MNHYFVCLFPLNTFTRKGRGLVIKTIRELAHEEFLAVIRVGSKASKAFKGVLYVFFLSQRSRGPPFSALFRNLGTKVQLIFYICKPFLLFFIYFLYFVPFLPPSFPILFPFFSCLSSSLHASHHPL